MTWFFIGLTLGVGFAHPIRYWLSYGLVWLGVKILWLKTPLWLLSQWVSEDGDD